MRIFVRRGGPMSIGEPPGSCSRWEVILTGPPCICSRPHRRGRDGWQTSSARQPNERFAVGLQTAALRLLERALAEPPASGQRPALMLARGVAAFMSAHPQAEALLREAVAEAQTPEIRAGASMTLSQLEVGAGRPGDAVLTLEQAIAELGSADPERAQRLELYLITTVAVRGARWGRVQEPLVALRETAVSESWLRRVVCGCLIWQESLRPAGPRPEALVALRAELGDPCELAEGTGPLDFVYFNWAMMGLEQIDELASARDALGAAARVAQKAGHLAGLAPVLATRAAVLYALGDLSGAEADARQAGQVGPAVGNSVARDWGLSTLCMVLADRGEHNAAEEELAIHELENSDPGPSGLEARLLIGRAYLRSAEGKQQRSCADVMRYGARFAAYDGAAFGSLPAVSVRILVAGGQTEFARALVDRALEVSSRSGIDGIHGMAVHAQALLERGATAVRSFQKAVRLLEHSPRKLELARALADLGAALRRTNQRAGAREPLRRAMDLAHQCGAYAVAEHARRELLATGARPRRMMRTGREALTASELRVAELAADGYSITGIAQALFVTRKTVETHLYAAYRKLDVNTRAGLADAMRGERGDPPPVTQARTATPAA